MTTGTDEAAAGERRIVEARAREGARQVRRAIEALAQADRETTTREMIEDVTQRIAHEINNPLAGAVTNLELAVELLGGGDAQTSKRERKSNHAQAIEDAKPCIEDARQSLMRIRCFLQTLTTKD